MQVKVNVTLTITYGTSTKKEGKHPSYFALLYNLIPWIVMWEPLMLPSQYGHAIDCMILMKCVGSPCKHLLYTLVQHWLYYYDDNQFKIISLVSRVTAKYDPFDEHFKVEKP